MKLKKQIHLIFIIWITSNSISGQTGYSVFLNNSQYFLYSIDLNTCEICQLSIGISALEVQLGVDLTMLPNGNWISNNNCALNVMSSVPNSTVIYNYPSPSDECIAGTVYDEINDVVYVLARNGLYTLDPITFTLTLVGLWPVSWNTPNMAGIHFTNGILYGTAVFIPGGYQLFEIDINDPENSTILFPVFGNDGQSSSSNGFYYTESGEIGEFDLVSQTTNVICDFIPPFGYAIIDVPTFPLPDYDCIITCDTDAGEIPTTDPMLVCVNEPASITPAINTELETDDILQYILFTDLNDTLGTIIATSHTPDFIFDPATITIGVTYYITSIAADDDGTGNTGFSDPCFDIGTTAQAIEWVPEPTVIFTVANNEICENGCKEINAVFTGFPPFTLTYQVGNDPEVIQIFNTENGNFEICIGAETGTIDLKAVALSDEVCCGN